jgi:hypothetical protein
MPPLQLLPCSATLVHPSSRFILSASLRCRLMFPTGFVHIAKHRYKLWYWAPIPLAQQMYPPLPCIKPSQIRCLRSFFTSSMQQQQLQHLLQAASLIQPPSLLLCHCPPYFKEALDTSLPLHTSTFIPTEAACPGLYCCTSSARLVLRIVQTLSRLLQ